MIILYEPANSPDMYYRCGFDSDASCLLLDSKNDSTLYVPGFEYLRAKKEVQDIAIKQLTNIQEIVQDIQEDVISNYNLPHRISQHIQTKITLQQEAYPKRNCKQETEIAQIQQAQQLTKQAIQIIVDILANAELREGIAYYQDNILTSDYCKLQARTFLLQHQADCPELIVASAKQTAQPHNRGSGPIKQGPVIIDIFAQANSKYHGDCTRTVILGEDTKAQQMLAAVQQVHDECIQKCVPGANIADIHTHAKKRLEELGYKTTPNHGLIHSLGHGVGLAVHESPNVSEKNTQTLKKHMVVTIEPGLYYEMGVRHENIIVVDQPPRIL